MVIDDLCAVNQCRGQLLRILVDGFNHPLGVLDLVDRILKLLIQHAAVGDHDDAVEDLLIVFIMEARQTVRKPGDAVGLAAASGVLDQVVAACSFLPGGLDDLSHCVELVVARKNHRFLSDSPFPALAVVHLFLVFLDEHEVAEDIEEAVELQHLLPKVTCPVAGQMLRVASAALNRAGLATAVERQEMGRLLLQASRHVHFVWICGEMHQRPLFELKQRRVRIAVVLVLFSCMAPALPCAGVFQLAGRDRQAIHGEDQIHRVVLIGVTEHLAC